MPEEEEPPATQPTRKKRKTASAAELSKQEEELLEEHKFAAHLLTLSQDSQAKEREAKLVSSTTPADNAVAVTILTAVPPPSMDRLREQKFLQTVGGNFFVLFSDAASERLLKGAGFDVKEAPALQLRRKTRMRLGASWFNSPTFIDLTKLSEESQLLAKIKDALASLKSASETETLAILKKHLTSDTEDKRHIVAESTTHWLCTAAMVYSYYYTLVDPSGQNTDSAEERIATLIKDCKQSGRPISQIKTQVKAYREAGETVYKYNAFLFVDIRAKPLSSKLEEFRHAFAASASRSPDKPLMQIKLLERSQPLRFVTLWGAESPPMLQYTKLTRPPAAAAAAAAAATAEHPVPNGTS